MSKPQINMAFEDSGRHPNTTANFPRQKPTSGCHPWRKDRRHLGIYGQRTVARFAVVLDIRKEWAIISWNDISPAFLWGLQSTDGQSVVTNAIPSALQV